MPNLESGQIIDGYRIVSILGQGGMGSVYKAVQLSMQREVALKVLSSELAERDPSFCHRFVEEARAAGRFNHPNIIGVHDVGETNSDDGQRIAYIVMEVVEGDDCKMLLKRHGRLDRDLIGRIMLAISDVLIYAEQIGIVHRDIKPENIMLTKDHMVKLADLGLALRTDEPEAIEQARDSKVKHRVMGTPRYMSPEQARGRQVDHRSDQYCLGATLFHMLTGQPPFEGKSSKELMRAHVLDPVPNPADIADIPRPWCELCLTMMAKRPEDRYPSAVALKTALQRVINGLMPPRADASEIAHLRPRRRNRSSGTASIGIGIVAVGILAAIVFLATRTATIPQDQPEDPQHQPEQSDSGSERLARARQTIETLPDEDEAALAILARAMRNPYFSQNEEALSILRQAHDLCKQRLESTTDEARQEIERRLKTIAALIAVDNLEQAWTQLKAFSVEDQALVQDAYRNLVDEITTTTRERTTATRTAIQQSEDGEEISRLLRSYRNSVPTDLFDRRLVVMAERRKQSVESLRRQREEHERTQRQESDAKQWAKLEEHIRTLRGTGPFDQLRQAAETAATALHDEQRRNHAASLLQVLTQVEALESRIQAFVAEQQPVVSMALGERPQQTRILAMDTNHVVIQPVSMQGSTRLPRSRPEIPYADLARQAIGRHDALYQAIPHFLWCWMQPEGEPPRGFESIDAVAHQDDAPIDTPTLPGPKDGEALQINLRQQAREGAALFHTDETLRPDDDGLHWQATTNIDPAMVAEADIPTLALRQAITAGSHIILECAVPANAMIAVGLRNQTEAFRLAINTQHNLTGALIRNNDRAIFDRARGTIRSPESLTGTRRIEIITATDGTINFQLDGTPWLDGLNPIRSQHGPHVFTDPQQPLELVIQALPTRHLAGALTLHLISITPP